MYFRQHASTVARTDLLQLSAAEGHGIRVAVRPINESLVQPYPELGPFTGSIWRGWRLKKPQGSASLIWRPTLRRAAPSAVWRFTENGGQCCVLPAGGVLPWQGRPMYTCLIR